MRKFQAVLAVAALALCSGVLALAAPGVSLAADSGAQNYLSDEAYKDFGFGLQDPVDFASIEESGHPLEDYKRMTLSELYIGRMNRYTEFDGSFVLANNVQSLSADELNIDNMRQHTVGTETAFKYGTTDTRDTEVMEYQLHDAVGVDHDGDEVDVVFDNTLYVGTYGMHETAGGKKSMQRLALYDVDGNEIAQELCIDLADDTTWDPRSVWTIRQNSANGYTALTAGDFDQDGMEEVAVYVPFNSDRKHPYIAIVKVADGALTVAQEIPLSTIGEPGQYDKQFSGWSLPIVQLSTTQIAGRDELVINASLPRKSTSDGYTDLAQSATMSIMGLDADSGKLTQVYNYRPTYGSYRMRFASTADSDLNGNNVKELVLAGYKNVNASDNAMGDIDGNVNLVQAFTYENGAYVPLWDAPQEVPALPGLDVDNIELEPAALSTGRYYNDGKGWGIFLEGKVFRMSGYTSGSASEAAGLRSGVLNEVAAMQLAGDDHPWISRAVSSCFSITNLDTDQIVIQSGDSHKDEGKEIYYDLSWMWNTTGDLEFNMTNNNWVNQRSMEDDGTFLTLCAMDVDKDTAYFQLQDKAYGWSKPSPVAITLSTPYWEELDYGDNVTFGRGQTSFGIVSSHEQGVTDSFKVGGGANFNAEQMLGADIGVGEASGGFSLNLEGVGLHVSDYYEGRNTSTSFTYNSPGGTNGVVMMAVPLVSYTYKVVVPEYTVTQEFCDEYATLYGTECPYRVGETLTDKEFDCSVDNQYAPTYHLLSLDEYNELARTYAADGMVEIDANAILPHELGDPTTYPSSTDALRNVVDGEVFVSDNPVVIDEGKGSTVVDVGVEDTETTEKGSDGTFHAALSAQFHSEIGWLIKSESQLGGGASFEIGGGRTRTTSDMSGSHFTSELVKMPAGSDLYRYNAQMAVWRTALSGTDRDGGEVKEYPAVIGYLVTGADRNAVPPSLPPSPRVYSATTDSVTLAWDDVNTTLRPAMTYGICMADQYGSYKQLARIPAGQNYYVAENLQPGTEYSFKLKAYGSMQAGSIESALSREIKAFTLEADAPIIDAQPSSIAVPEGESATFSVAAHSQAGRELHYQWMRYVRTEGAYFGSWESILGATGASYTVNAATSAMDGDKYRVDVYESDYARGYIASNYSDIATLSVGDAALPEVSLTVTRVSPGPVLQPKDDELIVGWGVNMALQADIAPAPGTAVKNATVKFYVYDGDGALIETLNGFLQTTAEGDVHYRGYFSSKYGVCHIVAVAESIETEAAPTVEQAPVPEADPAQAQDTELDATQDPELASTRQSEPEPQAASSTTLANVASTGVTVSGDVIDAKKGTRLLSYLLNAGMALNDPANIEAFTDKTLDGPLLSAYRPGFQFKGWYLDQGLTQPLAELRQPVALRDIHVYADWEPVDYDITYELDGGVNNLANPLTRTVLAPSFKLQDPQKAGYRFTGWYADAQLTQPVTHLAAGGVGDMTLHAGWELETYPIFYNAFGGANPASNPQTYTVRDQVTFAPPFDSGVWYRDYAFTAQVGELPVGSTGTVVLYGKSARPDVDPSDPDNPDNPDDPDNPDNPDDPGGPGSPDDPGNSDDPTGTGTGAPVVPVGTDGGAGTAQGAVLAGTGDALAPWLRVLAIAVVCAGAVCVIAWLRKRSRF